MADNQQQNLSGRFKAIRNHFGLKQVDFAKKAGILQSQVSQAETNGDNITPTIKLALAKNIKINIDWLESGVGEMFIQPVENKPYEFDRLNDIIIHNNKIAERGEDYVTTAKSEAERLGYYVTIYQAAKSMPMENFIKWCADNQQYFKT